MDDDDGGGVLFHIPFYLLIPRNWCHWSFPQSQARKQLPQFTLGICGSQTKAPRNPGTHGQNMLKKDWRNSFHLHAFSVFHSVTLSLTQSHHRHHFPTFSHFIRGTDGREERSNKKEEEENRWVQGGTGSWWLISGRVKKGLVLHETQMQLVWLYSHLIKATFQRPLH